MGKFYASDVDSSTSRVNVKLGGINAVLENPGISDPNNPVIVMGVFIISLTYSCGANWLTIQLGADVMHPAPGAEGRPSFSSLVASIDSNMAKYVAINRVQMGRLEIIDDLKEMVKVSHRQGMI